MAALAAALEVERLGAQGGAWVWALSAGLSVLVLCGLILYLACRLATAGRDGDEPEGEEDGGWGGGGRRRPDRPPRPGGDPAWWPDFERQFADYARVEGPRGDLAPDRRELVGADPRS